MPLVLNIGIVASKKQVSKRAVDRNTVKRRIRAALQLVDHEGLAALAVSRRLGLIRILVVCNKACLTDEFNKIKENLNSSLIRLVTSLNALEDQ
jgi:ribonuclease P protein component